jgi:hypothetical protein
MENVLKKRSAMPIQTPKQLRRITARTTVILSRAEISAARFQPAAAPRFKRRASALTQCATFLILSLSTV